MFNRLTPMNGGENWIAPEALAAACALLPHLGIAANGIHHGTPGIHGIGRYCACCDAFKRGAQACEDCNAPWERTS
jgi:hypothetical protein